MNQILFGLFIQSTIANAFTRTPAVTRNEPNGQQHRGQHLCATEETKYPMLVVGSESAALGAAMALCAREILLLPGESQVQQQRPPTPATQLVAFCNAGSENDPSSSPQTTGEDLQTCLLLGQYQAKVKFGGPSVTEYQQMFTDTERFFSSIYENENDYGRPILHVIYGSHSHGSSSGVLLDPVVRNSVSFTGYDFYAPLADDGGGKLMLPRDDAVQIGKTLQSLLTEGNIKPLAAVTMDFPTHLSLLQANTLPKTRGVLGDNTDNDYWALRDTVLDGLSVDDSGDGVLLEYSYDFDNYFGGSDPLACPSMGYTLSSPIPVNRHRSLGSLLRPANDALAAAYTAMKGYGMDPVASLCVANSVKAVFLDAQTSYTWDTIDRIVSYSKAIRQDIQQVDGLGRKKYREFGYK